MSGSRSSAGISRRLVNASLGAGRAAAVTGLGAALACVWPFGRAPSGEGS